jgi:hypothetical protein
VGGEQKKRKQKIPIRGNLSCAKFHQQGTDTAVAPCSCNALSFASCRIKKKKKKKKRKKEKIQRRDKINSNDTISGFYFEKRLLIVPNW